MRKLLIENESEFSVLYFVHDKTMPYLEGGAQFKQCE